MAVLVVVTGGAAASGAVRTAGTVGVTTADLCTGAGDGDRGLRWRPFGAGRHHRARVALRAVRVMAGCRVAPTRFG